MRISLRQLQIFLAVAGTGSTTAAAHQVALSQSATSAALNELEAVLQTRLFDRVGKRLLLNDNGRQLLPQARQMQDAASTIEHQFTECGDSGLCGLKIGASTTIGIYLIPEILAHASPDRGDVLPCVTIANTMAIADAVERFDIDIGLVEGPCHQTELHVEPWVMDELVIVGAPNHPLIEDNAGNRVNLKTLRSAGWLLREPGSGTREAVEHVLAPHLHTLRAAGEFSNAEAIKHAAAVGLGLACLSRRVVHDFLDSGRLVQLQTTLPLLSRRFYLIHHRRKVLSTRLQNFLQFCRDWKHVNE